MRERMQEQTQKRNLHGWHIASLGLAFIAGAAVFSNPRWFGGQSSIAPNADVVLASAADAETDPVTETDLGDVLDVAKLPAPDSVPLYLQNELEDLRELSDRYREEIDDLTETVAKLSVDLEGQTNSESSNLQGGQQGATAASVGGDVRAPEPRSRTERQRDALLQAGVDTSVIDSFQQRRDRQALARLDLIDTATREGWGDSERLNQALEDLDQSTPRLRDELGDEAFDSYLENFGSRNRVRVTSIIGGSNADLAGMQVGDIIYQYASTRIFTRQELQSATREGVRDEPIIITVIRDDQKLVLNGVRGPLGVSMAAIRSDAGS